MNHLALLTLFLFPAMTISGQTARMIAVAMCLLCCHPKAEKRLSEPGILLIAWFLWAALCSLLGDHFDMSLFGYYKRFEGLSMWLLAIGFGWLFWRCSTLPRLFLTICAILSICLSVMLIKPEIYKNIIYGHITISAFAAVGSCMLMAKHPAFIACAIPFTFLTSNRSIIFALMFGAGAYLALNFKRLHKEVISTIVTLLAIAVVGVLPKLLTLDLKSLGTGARTAIATKALEHIAIRPVMGYGVDTQSTLFGKSEHETITQHIRGKPVAFKVDIDRCHNVFLDIAIQTGLVGLALWLFLLTRMTYRAFSYPSEVNTACLCGIAAFIGFGLWNPTGIPSIFLACVCILGIERKSI